MMVNVELDDYQMEILKDLLVVKIAYGGDVWSMKEYIALYDIFKEKLDERK